jgi:hypothetical protein
MVRDLLVRRADELAGLMAEKTQQVGGCGLHVDVGFSGPLGPEVAPVHGGLSIRSAAAAELRCPAATRGFDGRGRAHVYVAGWAVRFDFS